jgi:hypothetical protein
VPFLLTVEFQRTVFVTSDDHVVTVGPQLIAVYTISHLAQCNKHRTLPLYHIDLKYGRVSEPFPDRGYHWMVIVHGEEFLLMRLSRDMIGPLRVASLGRNPIEYDGQWGPGVTRHATICQYYDWTMKIMTYSWDVEMTQCTFHVKNVCLPEFAKNPQRLQNVGLDMANGRLIYLDSEDRNLIILDTA